MVTRQSVFTFYDRLYKQLDGSGMGKSVSLVLAKKIVEKLESDIVAPSQSLRLCPLLLLFCRQGKSKGPLGYLMFNTVFCFGIYGIDCFKHCHCCDSILHKCSVINTLFAHS